MPVLYKPFQSVLEDKNKKKLFHPRVIYTANVSTAQLAKENTLDNLVTVSAQHLQASESVTLDGFGTFRMVMKSNGKGVEVPEKVSAAQASLTVRFLPNYTKNPDRTTATRSLVTGAKCVRFDLADTSASGGGDSGKPDGGGSGSGGSGDGGGEAPDPAA